MRPFLLSLILAACGPDPVTEADLAEASRVATAWFDAVTAGDCPALMRLSRTKMTEVQCRIEIRVLAERSPLLLGVERVREHPARPGAIEVEARVLEDGASETIVALTLERLGGAWVVAF